MFIYAYDAVTGAQKWRRAARRHATGHPPGRRRHRGHGAVEVAGLETGGAVDIVDGATRSVQATIPAEGTSLTRRHRHRADPSWATHPVT